MDAQEHLPGSDAAASARHSLDRPVAVPDPAPDRAGGAWFTVVLRGYDRAQVDARLSELDRRVRDEARRAEKAEAALGAARSHVRFLQDGAGQNASAGGEERGFGIRVERVLQAAEREASDLREKAATEATTLLDRARDEAEQRRAKTEQALLGRAATLDREFTARSEALDSREREVDEKIATAQQEADRIRETAERAATEDRAGAERRAEELVRRAEETAREQRADLARDVERLSALRDQVREELSRLREVLDGELERAPVAATLDEHLFGPAGRDDPGAGGDTRLGDTPDGDTSDGDTSDGDLLTGRLRIATSAAGSDDDDPNERTEIGAIPPFTVSSIGVLPFRDRSVGTPGTGNGRPFPGRTEDTNGSAGGDDASPAGGLSGAGSDARTSDDESSPNGSPTRSTSSSRGPR